MSSHGLISWIILTLMFSTAYAQAQEEKPEEKVFTPYRSERMHYEHLRPYYRYFDTLETRNELDRLQAKRDWDHRDSIRLVVNLVKLKDWGRVKKLLPTLHRPLMLEDDEPILFALAYQQAGQWDKAREFVGLATFEANDADVTYYWSKMLSYRAMMEENKNWGKEHSVFQFDTSMRPVDISVRELRDSVLRQLRAMDEVLHWQILIIPSEDQVIADMAVEMGIILEKYSSFTEGWLMYNLAKQYSKYDLSISKHMKRAKLQMTEHRYRVPSFRRYFPKIEPSRFQYSFLKEKMLQEDTTKNAQDGLPIYEERDKEKYPWLNTNLIIAVSCLLLIIIVGFALRTKKN